MKAKQIALAAIGFLILSAAPASAKQMDASDDPTVAGPLSTNEDLKGCTSKNRKRNGRLVARFRICGSYYLYDPEQESNADRDFGALWTQVTVDSTNGWCTKEVQIDLELPEKGVHAKAPKPGTTEGASKPHKYTTKLKVDADGAGETPGTIENTFTLYKKHLKAKVTKDDFFRVAWDGNSDKKLAFISGVEISWATGEQPPPLVPLIKGLFKKRGC